MEQFKKAHRLISLIIPKAVMDMKSGLATDSRSFQGQQWWLKQSYTLAWLGSDTHTLYALGHSASPLLWKTVTCYILLQPVCSPHGRKLRQLRIWTSAAKHATQPSLLNVSRGEAGCGSETSGTRDRCSGLIWWLMRLFFSWALQGQECKLNLFNEK